MGYHRCRGKRLWVTVSHNHVLIWIDGEPNTYYFEQKTKHKQEESASTLVKLGERLQSSIRCWWGWITLSLYPYTTHFPCTWTSSWQAHYHWTCSPSPRCYSRTHPLRTTFTHNPRQQERSGVENGEVACG